MTAMRTASGALLAAEAGLFDGFRCTTHAACMAELAQRAPLAQPRDHFALDGEVAQQVVELDGDRQEVVTRQRRLVAQLAQ